MKTNNLDLLILLVLVLFLVVVLSRLSKKSTEQFTSSQPYFDYLLTDGEKFYLYNARMLVSEGVNPLSFSTLEEVRGFEHQNNLQQLSVTDLVVKKVNDDPQENYERVCAKKIAPLNSEINACLAYTKDENQLDEMNLLFSSMNSVDRDIESCMMKTIVEENPELGRIDNEIKYMTQFY